MHTILLTGATGFLGRLCLQLLQGGTAEVHTVARQPAPHGRGIHAHALNLLDADAVARLIRQVRPTHLLHLAWETTPGAYWTSAANHRWLDASWQLIEEFALQGGRRAVIAGTCAEYDWTGSGVCDEISTPLKPATLYGACKAQLGERVRQLAQQGHLSTAWARLFFLYGPGEHPRRLVPSVIQSLLSGEDVACTSGVQQRDFLHAADAASALVKLLGSSFQGPINIASGQAVAVGSVIAEIAAHFGAPERIRSGAVPRSPSDPDLLVARVARLQHQLGWRPSISLSAGLADTISWWRAHERRNAA